jgi:hypothetical protein
LKHKKIRGLRRRQKELNQWMEFHKEINIERLKKDGYVYAKAKFGPWANLVTETPYPSIYRRQLFSSLIKFYFSWKQALEKEFDHYYLRIWLFYPRFINSQIVAAIGDKADYYENLFEIQKQEKDFPLSVFNHEIDNIARFVWKTGIDEDYYLESEFKEIKISDYSYPDAFFADQRFYRSLIKENVPFRLIKNEQSGKEEKLYRKHKGGLWIGEIKK